MNLRNLKKNALLVGYKSMGENCGNHIRYIIVSMCRINPYTQKYIKFVAPGLVVVWFFLQWISLFE